MRKKKQELIKIEDSMPGAGRRRRRRRVKLGHCASLLAPSGILNELVALRRWLTPGPKTT